MMFSQLLNTQRIFKRLAKALISLRLCAGWSEALLVAHTTLLEISCHGLYIRQLSTDSVINNTVSRLVQPLLFAKKSGFLVVEFIYPGLSLNIVFKIPRLFTDFFVTFDRFPDHFGRSILAIFIYRQLENFVQIFMRSD